MRKITEIILEFKSKFSPERLKNYAFYLAHYFWAPIFLTLLFVWQNLAFNNWLGIFPGQYLIRRGLVTFALGTVLFGPAVFFKKTVRHLYLFFACAFVSSIFISEFIYYQYFGAFLQASAIKYIGQATTQTQTISSFLTFGLLFFLINFIFWAIDLFLFSKFNQEHSKLNFKEKLLTFIVISLIVYTAYGHLVRVEAKEWGHTDFLYKKIFDYDNYVSKVGIVNFFLQDTSKYIFKKNKVSDSDKEFLKNWLSKKSEDSRAQYFGAAKNKNLIMIQVESLDGILVNTIINNQEITPNLNQLAAKGIYFPNYYAQFALGTTADAEFSILNSLYPLPEDVAFERYPKNYYLALPKILNLNGYQTFSFHGDVVSFWNRANIYPNLGFSAWFSRDDFVSNNPLGGAFELSDQDFFEQSIIKLENLPKPFAAILMTLSLHTPFTIPDGQKSLNLENEDYLSQNQKDYLQAAAYTDKTLGEFINSLKQNGLYDQSIILIYGDHGSYTDIEKVIGEKNHVQESFNNARVPLIILNSGIETNITIQSPASHIDLFPTLINLLGIKTQIKFLGQDIFNTKEPTVTKRKNISGQISAILVDNVLFAASSNGEFKDGMCYDLNENKNLPIDFCQKIYQDQNDTINASDIIIRGNLAEWLNDSKP